MIFYLTKTLSVESARLYFSHRLSSIGEYIFQVLFLTCLPHQQLLAFSSLISPEGSSLRSGRYLGEITSVHYCISASLQCGVLQVPPFVMSS